MKAIMYIAVISFLVNSETHALEDNYDIIIACKDNQEIPTKIIELKLSTLGGRALLNYQGSGKEFFKLAFEENSDLWIKNGSNGPRRVIRISAHQANTSLVTHVARFSLELEEESPDLYKPTSLAMSRGTLEFPQSVVEISPDLKNMTCVIKKIESSCGYLLRG
jgi:hypothetical protein